jgi:NAD(P)-dependent dehydrogenase (short-subunit alcohol dehydrogenase family)
VLAARGEAGLNAVAERIRAGGAGAAHVVVTDVTDPAQVERLAGGAVARFGRIDTWVNNAGVSEYATVEQMTPQEIEQIVRVDLLGTIYGCKAAVPRMKGNGGGTIINVGSGFSDRAVPLQSVYCAAKHGVKGFTEALRLELAREQSGIRVTLILPSSVNTPFFEHARSKTGHKPKPLGPVYEPEVVADAILYAAEHPRRDVYVGGTAKLLSLMETVSPGLLDWLMLQRDWAASGQVSDEPDDGRDNLFGPMSNGRVRARERRARTRTRSVYTDVVERHPVVSRLLFAAMAAGVAVGLVRSVSGGLGGRKTVAVR